MDKIGFEKKKDIYWLHTNVGAGKNIGNGKAYIDTRNKKDVKIKQQICGKVFLKSNFQLNK